MGENKIKIQGFIHVCVCGDRGGWRNVDLLLEIVKYALLWKEKRIKIYKEQIHDDFLDIYCHNKSLEKLLPFHRLLERKVCLH